MVKIIECPRDAMQGIEKAIPTDRKVFYLRKLLKCRFHTLDCGSFVNPAAVPQMADTAQVLEQIGGEKGGSRFLVIVANERGAREALQYDCVDDLGFPFSINETFQIRNANSTIEEAFIRLNKIQNLSAKNNRNVVVYLSMAFGNPYNEIYNREDVLKWTEKIQSIGITTISLADTVATASENDVKFLFSEIHRNWPHIETGAHFHARPNLWISKIKTAYDTGCRRFDGALLGFGGCPFANDELTGNVPTEGLIKWLQEFGNTGIDFPALQEAMNTAGEVLVY